MTNVEIHRCRLFEFQPPAVQCMVSRDIEGTNFQELAVGQENGAIQIVLSSPTGFYTRLTIPGSARRVEDLAWYQNRLFSADLQGEITEYNLVNGTVDYSTDSFGGAVWCLAMAYDKPVLAAGCEDGSIKIFDCSERLQFQRSLDKQEGRILSCAFHPNNETLVSGSVNTIRIWSFKTGRAIKRIRLESSRRTEIIVWTVKLLSNNTVISGDSTGKVQFWNSKSATLIQSFHSHHADILTICVSKDEKAVYAAGIDPKVVEMKFVEAEEDEGAKMEVLGAMAPPNQSVGKWVKGPILQKHTHDIRSLVTLGAGLASGGVDTSIVFKPALNKNDRRMRKCAMFPHKSLVHLAPESRTLLFQNYDNLDLWKLGTTGGGQFEREDVQLETQPRRLLQIKCSSQDSGHVACSCISNCGRWIAYSTKSSFRLFRVNWLAESPNEVNLVKVRATWFKPVYNIIFTNDSGLMILSMLSGKIFIVKLDDSAHAHITHVFKKSADSPEQLVPCHLLATSDCNKYLATGDSLNQIRVYNLEKQEVHCTLPQRDNTPTAIKFKPNSSELFIVYQDHTVMEYDIVTKSYTRWCREAMSLGFNLLKFQQTKKVPSIWNCSPVLFISFVPKSTESQEKIILASQKSVYVIDQALPLSKEIWEGEVKQLGDVKVRRCQGSKKDSLPVKYFPNFKPLLFVGAFDKGKSLIAVERPFSEIYDNLPPSLYQKKFGT